jgi:hypothetical protein
MLFLTFWLLFGQAKSNKACMADAKQNEKQKQHENKKLIQRQLWKLF